MSSLYLMLPAAKKKGARMAYYNVGTGPVNTPMGRRILRELSEIMDFMTVRDQDSYDILRNIGVRNPRLLIAADAALNAGAVDAPRARDILAKTGLDPSREILGININAYIDTWAGPHIKAMGRERFLSVYAEALNRALKDIDAPVLFICTQHLDIDITQDLMSRTVAPRGKAIVTNREYDHYEVKGLLGQIALLFGMRLHSMILCSSTLTPILGLAYQPKIDHYFSNLGLSDYRMGFESFSADSLVAHLKKGWADRAAVRRHLGERIPLLQKKARKPAELVAAIHRGDDLDATFKKVAAEN